MLLNKSIIYAKKTGLFDYDQFCDKLYQFNDFKSTLHGKKCDYYSDFFFNLHALTKLVIRNIMVSIFFLFPVSDIMDLRHQSSAMCIIMLGGGRRHTPVVCNESREPNTSHYTNTSNKKTTNKLLKPATMQSTGRNFLKAAMI